MNFYTSSAELIRIGTTVPIFPAKRQLIAAFIAVLAGFSLPCSAGEADGGLLTVIIINDSLTANHIMIRDENCVRPERSACEQARQKITNPACRENPILQDCLSASQLAEGPVCSADLAYRGVIAAGGRIRIVVCASASGYGNISVRAENRTSAWSRYSMLDDGDAVKYP